MVITLSKPYVGIYCIAKVMAVWVVSTLSTIFLQYNKYRHMVSKEL